MLTKSHDDADMVFPGLARILWLFGPLDWWSYITPVAFAVGVAARINVWFRTPVLCAILAFSIMQTIVILGAFEPFAKIGESMGYPEPTPYPALPLVINAAMAAISMLFASASIRRMKSRGT